MGKGGSAFLCKFGKGTFAIAKMPASSFGFSMVGGGNSVSAVNKAGVAGKISHSFLSGERRLSNFVKARSYPASKR